ncbi:MAG TPA: ABC transporter permease [Vicinamibacteria bacterium]|nr:ABC transporter permease [Vicinamibacteria bacterium]
MKLSLGNVYRGVRALVSRPRQESELDDELRLHLEMETEANVRRGLPPDEARRAALLSFGGVEQAKEGCRETWRGRFLEVLAQDVRYGLRGLRRSPGFTAAIVLTLGLGIGANTAVFSLINGVLLKPLPYARGEQVVVLRQPESRSRSEDLGFSPLEVRDYREMSHAFDGLVEYHSMDFTLLGGGDPRRVRAGVVSANFFDVLEVKPLLGRTFRPDDEAPGADAVLVLSHDYWRTLGSEASVVGRRFEMNDRVHTVVGVLPPIPQYPQENDVYMPSTACPFRNRPAVLENRRARMLGAFARIAPGVSLPQAQAEVEGVSRRLRAAYPDAFARESDARVALSPLKEDLVRGARPTFLVLLATVALVLLIACANVANLTLARLVERSRELAIRSALGAGRARLLRQLLTESTILALGGGALGLSFAFATRDLLTAFAARLTPRAGEVEIDVAVLLFTLVTSVLTGVLAGTLPGLPGRERIAPVLLAENVRATGDRRRQRLRAGLVAWQLALSFVLLIGAALMLRSFANLRSVDAGFKGDHVLTARLNLNFSTYTNAEHRIDVERVNGFYRALEDRLRALPGVVALGTAWTFPLNNAFQNDGTFTIEGRGEASGPPPKATFIGVSPAYFETLGVPLLRGRVFDERDRGDAPVMVVVNQRLARRHWGEADPVGQRISSDGGRTWRTIVGMVGDVRQEGLDRDPGDAVYLPFRQFPGFGATLFVRTMDDPARVAEQVRAAALASDSQTAVTALRTLDDIRSEALSSPRLTTVLLGLFAGLALVITAAGLSGLIAYSVSQRTHEIGIRMALGADRPTITAMVLREGLTSVATGLAVGIVGALALSRLVSGLLFGVGPNDPACYAGSALVLLGVSVAGCLLPARRATAVSPMAALRGEG